MRTSAVEDAEDAAGGSHAVCPAALPMRTTPIALLCDTLRPLRPPR